MISDVLMGISSSSQRHGEILLLPLVIDIVFSYLKKKGKKNLNFMSTLGDATNNLYFQVIKTGSRTSL